MYACGPTVYRLAHVGNLRTFVLPDLIRRNAERHGRPVILCQNITDVGHLADDSEIDPDGEDKVLAQARAEGKSPLEVARFYESAFWADCAELNIAPPDYAPRASESIDLMIDMISKLIAADHAYATGSGSVYFDVRSVPDYGALSGNRLEDLRPGTRLSSSVDEDKRFHADWALWKGAPPGRELTWQSPWGTGFPGWHTECSDQVPVFASALPAGVIINDGPMTQHHGPTYRTLIESTPDQGGLTPPSGLVASNIR
jgi:cysteinyl-tRNA synthetase